MYLTYWEDPAWHTPEGKRARHNYDTALEHYIQTGAIISAAPYAKFKLTSKGYDLGHRLAIKHKKFWAVFKPDLDRMKADKRYPDTANDWDVKTLITLAIHGTKCAGC